MDDPDNLTTLRRKCHRDLHSGALKGAKKIQGLLDSPVSVLKHATQRNSIRKQLLSNYLNAVETF